MFLHYVVTYFLEHNQLISSIKHHHQFTNINFTNQNNLFTLSITIQVRPSCVRPFLNTSAICSVIKANTSLFQSLSSTFLASLSFSRSLLVQYRGTHLFASYIVSIYTPYSTLGVKNFCIKLPCSTFIVLLSLNP